MRGILSQCITCMSNHHDVHFKYLTILFVNYTSTKLKKETWYSQRWGCPWHKTYASISVILGASNAWSFAHSFLFVVTWVTDYSCCQYNIILGVTRFKNFVNGPLLQRQCDMEHGIRSWLAWIFWFPNLPTSCKTQSLLQFFHPTPSKGWRNYCQIFVNKRYHFCCYPFKDFSKFNRKEETAAVGHQHYCPGWWVVLEHVVFLEESLFLRVKTRLYLLYL